MKSAFFYGWVIVAACTALQAIQSGIQYSFSIFFKPLIADFGWSRASTSGAYSLLMISAGISAIPLGWLADRFGPGKVAAASGFLIGLGLVLASRVSELWQLYVTIGVIVGIGVSGVFAIGTGVTARWFVKRRGLALGIVSAGVGIGTLVMSPISERLIAVFGWSTAYIIIGITAWVITIATALFLRRDPEEIGLQPYGVDAKPTESGIKETAVHHAPATGITLKDTVHTGTLWKLILLFLLFNSSVQVIMVHLVNYTTDLGISPFAAATVLSVIGIGSVAGRLVMGTASDRLGINATLIICCLMLVVSLVWLIFSVQLWMLYVFAVFFGFAYGGEVPQVPLLIGQFFGLRAVIALIGVISAALRAGGAVGSWMAGQVFDVTHSYIIAFIITAIASVLALMIAIMLKKTKTTVQH